MLFWPRMMRTLFPPPSLAERETRAGNTGKQRLRFRRSQRESSASLSLERLRCSLRCFSSLLWLR